MPGWPRTTVRYRAATVVLAAIGVVAGACGGDDLPAGFVRVAVEQDGRTTTVIAEVADDPVERARGLMYRTALASDAGMLFVFPSPSTGGFWMKNTKIPLRILFVRAGRVVEVATMEPCGSDPCPLTRPDEPYDWALEVPIAALAHVREGAEVRVRPVLPTPDA